MKTETKEKLMAIFLGLFGGMIMGVILEKIKNPIYLVTAVFIDGIFIGCLIGVVLFSFS